MAPPLIPYPGGKWYARRKITSLFPFFTTKMVSPFCGGGSIELEMEDKGVRVHASDIYEPLVNLYQQALLHPSALADAVSLHHSMDRARFAQLLVSMVYDSVSS